MHFTSLSLVKCHVHLPRDNGSWGSGTQIQRAHPTTPACTFLEAYLLIHCGPRGRQPGVHHGAAPQKDPISPTQREEASRGLG